MQAYLKKVFGGNLRFIEYFFLLLDMVQVNGTLFGDRSTLSKCSNRSYCFLALSLLGQKRGIERRQMSMLAKKMVGLTVGYSNSLKMLDWMQPRNCWVIIPLVDKGVGEQEFETQIVFPFMEQAASVLAPSTEYPWLEKGGWVGGGLLHPWYTSCSSLSCSWWDKESGEIPVARQKLPNWADTKPLKPVLAS